MGHAILPKNAVKEVEAIQEFALRVMELVALVSPFKKFIKMVLNCIFFFVSSVSLECGEKSVENNTYFQVRKFYLNMSLKR